MKNDDTRLAKAAMKSLRTDAPASLKLALKRQARARTASPSFWEFVRAGMTGRLWGYSAGAAFAAAAVAGLILSAPAPREAPTPVVHARPARVNALPAPPQALADLWADDDGADNDDI